MSGAENPRVPLERARRSFEAALGALLVGAPTSRVDVLLRDGLAWLEDICLPGRLDRSGRADGRAEQSRVE